MGGVRCNFKLSDQGSHQKVTFEQRPEGVEGPVIMQTWWRRIFQAERRASKKSQVENVAGTSKEPWEGQRGAGEAAGREEPG